MKNINTKSYWDERFKSGDWEDKSGRTQTQNFAISQVRHFKIPADFSGSILDFGCALGDAIPVYKKYFPLAKLYGMDISEEAVAKCREKYGHLATFFQGSHETAPDVDIIIASNVFEHLSDDKNIARQLLKKCKELFIVVPYNEDLKRSISEHINTYQQNSFKSVSNNYTTTVFASRGWTQYGWDLYVDIYLKNLFRPLFSKDRIHRYFQIMFHFKNS